MDSERRPILQGEYKLLKTIEEAKDSTIFLSQSIHASERRFSIREYKVSGYDAPEKRAMIQSYFQPIAQQYMDFLHPCLTSLRDFFLENERMYFLYDYIPGHRLSEILKIRSNKPFSEIQAVDMALKIAKAFYYLHALKPSLFFADMDPSSLILTSNGYVMLTDYGLGKLMTPYDPEKPRMGTLGYAAPEQIGPLGIVSKSTDIYSLGVLMHQLVTGVDPTINPNVLEPIEKFAPNISPDFVDIVKTATAPNPRDRFLEAADMLHALATLAPVRRRNIKNIKKDWKQELAAVVAAPFTPDTK